MITGVRTIRSVVPAASRRAERSPPRLCSGSPRARLMLPLGGAPRRRRSFTAGIRPGAMLSSRTPIVDQPHRGFGVARQLPAHADPAAVALAPRRRRRRSAPAPAPAPPRAGARAPGSRARRPSSTARGRWCRSRRSPGAARGDRPAARPPAPRSSRRPRSSPSPDPSARGVEQPARLHDLVDGRDHREHHGDGVLGRHAQDRAQLRREEVRVREREAQPAAAEERVVLAARSR